MAHALRYLIMIGLIVGVGVTVLGLFAVNFFVGLLFNLIPEAIDWLLGVNKKNR